MCYVILKNPSMRTSTNVFLCSLSMADVTILFLGKSKDLRKRTRWAEVASASSRNLQIQRGKSLSLPFVNFRLAISHKTHISPKWVKLRGSAAA